MDDHPSGKIGTDSEILLTLEDFWHSLLLNDWCTAFSRQSTAGKSGGRAEQRKSRILALDEPFRCSGGHHYF